MIRMTVASTLGALALMWSVAGIDAQQYGTADQAKAMLERAVAALKANKDAALSAFNDKNNKEFHDHDLYVFCFSMTNGQTVAHPNPALINTDVRAFTYKGDPLGKGLFDAVKPSGTNTFDYEFPKPGTIEPVPKESFVTRIGELGCGVGYYK